METGLQVIFSIVEFAKITAVMSRQCTANCSAMDVLIEPGLVCGRE